MSQQTFKIAIVANEEGGFDVGFFAADGSFQEGTENIAALLKALASENFEIPAVSDVDNPRAGSDTVMDRLHDVTHAVGHHHHHGGA